MLTLGFWALVGCGITQSLVIMELQRRLRAREEWCS